MRKVQPGNHLTSQLLNLYYVSATATRANGSNDSYVSEEEDEAELVKALLADPSAKPLLSLLAVEGDRPVGHVLFTHASLMKSQHSGAQHPIALLAPLAVVPECQRRGIGRQLIEQGLHQLSHRGIDLVFVLGYPRYYSRHGFEPAFPFGLEPSYPIAAEHRDAWMVYALRPAVLGTVSGNVICADALNHPDYWQE